MRKNSLRDLARHYPAQLFSSRPPQVCDAAEFAQQPLRRPRPNAGNITKRGFRLPLAAALAMKAYGKSMRLVANLLDQMQHWRVAVQNAGLIFLAEDV